MANWNRIYQKKGYYRTRIYPPVTKFFLKEKNTSNKVLDLGCGTGRHLIYLAKKGFPVVGIEQSQKAILLSTNWIKKEKLKNATITKGDFKKLRFASNSFDIVICIHAIYHGKLGDIKKSLNEIKRVLKKRGILLITFLSTRDEKYGKGKEIEKNSYIATSDLEKNVVHHFSDKAEILQLFRNFLLIKIKHRKETKKTSHWHWIVEAQKP